MLGGDSAPVAAIPAAAGAAPVAGPSSIRLVTTAAAPTAARIPSTTMPLGNKPRFAIFGPDPVRRARIVPHMFTVNKCRRSGLPPSPLSPAELADQGVDIDALRAERAAIIASRHSDSSSGTGPAGSAAALAFAVVSGNNARSQAGVSEVVRPPLVSKWSAREVTPHAPLIVQATRQLTALYRKCNPQLGYHSSQNPRRVLTVPSARMLNGGYDNASSNLIMAVGDTIYSDSGRFKGYRVLELLGQGTFGQVVKCEDCETKEIKAVKVIKNKPAYTGQAWVEIKIIRLLNQVHDPEDKKHILRLSDHFTYKNHLCLVFEMLSVNLYELIKQNQFRGVTVQLIRNFGKQMLEALATLKEAGVIHCDLKPENVLLCRLTAADIKVIDFGSACAENHTIYSYIQSRFYRAPEVLFGVPYTTAIDMWSFGCIIAELFLGLPLFPGSSQYNQIARIVQAIGNPPDRVILAPKSTAAQFFVPISAANIALHADAAPPGAANSPIRLPLEPIEVPPEPRGPVLPDGTRAPASTQQLIDHAAIVARARAQQHALAVTPSGMPLFECDANGVPVIRDSEGNPSSFVLKSAAAYAAETNSEPAVMKLYHKGYALIDVVFSYTMKKSMTPQARDKELSSRSKLLHLLQGLLQWDPIRRWTPYIAARHPFFTREPLETFDAAALAAAEAQAAQVAAQQRAALQQQQQIQQQQSQSQSQSRLIGDLKSFSASLAAMRERKAARPSPSAAPAASGGALSPATFAAAASGAAPPGMGSGAGSMEGSDASPVAAPANASAASLPPVGARGAVHHGPRASAAPVASGGTSSVASPTNASEDKAAATAAALYPPHTPPHRPGHPSLTPLTTPSTGPSAAGPFFAQGGTAAAAGGASGSAAAAAGAAGAAGAGASAAADGGYGAAAAGGMSPLVVAEQAPQEPTEVATEETEETEQGQ